MAILIDTSFLLAALYAKDANHQRALAAQKSLLGHERLVPAPVVQELFYMVTVRISYQRAVSVLEQMHTGAFEIVDLTFDDRRRMTEIMQQYVTAAFDYTDAAIMALSERLDIRQVYTFDHRDFGIFRPRHCEYLELLP